MSSTLSDEAAKQNTYSINGEESVEEGGAMPPPPTEQEKWT